jgi:2-polyprenyl-6-methoxyphenol hydroxylase-like FAD-dependent oxidoreductase
LTTGHLDAASLGNCLIRIIVEKESDELLSRYAKVRREAFVNVTNPESIGFKHRVSSMEPQHVEERGKFFEALNNDPEFHNHVAKSMAEVFQDFSSE